jgi:hypothetical protein
VGCYGGAFSVASSHKTRRDASAKTLKARPTYPALSPSTSSIDDKPDTARTDSPSITADTQP